MDPIKVQGVREWPVPTTTKEVCAFLGFANFYRRFVRGFSSIARPLNNLLKKEAHWDWTRECQHAFEELKNHLGEEPVLMQPNLDIQFELEVDALRFANGGVLYQKDKQGIKHPVTYYSQTFGPAECNYDIYDQELLAIV